MANQHQHMLDVLLARAGTDPEFRRQLLDDPRAAVSRALGSDVPAALNFRFIERDPDVDVMAVLPDPPPAAGELSLDDLDVVAGGVGAAWSDEPEEPGEV